MVNLKVTDRTHKLHQAIRGILKMEVYVGIPQAEDSARGKVSNAELLFIHTNGSPLKHIPARPVIEPAIEDDKEIISEFLGDALKAALDGNKTLANRFLKKAGLEGQAASQAWFTNPKNGWAPNAPYTVLQKIKKTKGKLYRRIEQYVNDGGSLTDISGLDGLTTPLIDTGQLRKAITFVIRKEL